MTSLEPNEDVLSSRELEVARLATQGLTTREIASSLFVSVPTVKTHLREIFRKCGVRNRVGLATWWFGRAGARATTGHRPAEAAIADPPPKRKATNNGRRKFLALAAAGAAAVAAVVAWQVYAGPLALGAGDSPPPPPPLGATMGGIAGGSSWSTAGGFGPSVSYEADCRLVETRLPGDGWLGLSLLSPEEDLTEAEVTRGWVQEGAYDCDYGPFVVTASDGRAFSIPSVPSLCYQATRSVAEAEGPNAVDRYGWYDGIIWCDEARVWAYVNSALAELGLQPETGDP